MLKDPRVRCAVTHTQNSDPAKRGKTKGDVAVGVLRDVIIKKALYKSKESKNQYFERELKTRKRF